MGYIREALNKILEEDDKLKEFNVEFYDGPYSYRFERLIIKAHNPDEAMEKAYGLPQATRYNYIGVQERAQGKVAYMVAFEYNYVFRGKVDSDKGEGYIAFNANNESEARRAYNKKYLGKYFRWLNPSKDNIQEKIPTDVQGGKYGSVFDVHQIGSESLPDVDDAQAILNPTHEALGEDHKLCLKEDFPNEIKRILLNKIKYAIFDVPYYSGAKKIYTINNFGSRYAEGTYLDIDKTEYKKLSKEEIANMPRWPNGTSKWPVGSLFIKPHGNIIIAACYGRGEWTWEFYFAVERSALADLSIWDYLHGKNISIDDIFSQTESWKERDMKNIKGSSIYIPIKPVSYDRKTVTNQLGKDAIDYDSLEQYTKKTFKLDDTLFDALANQSNSGFVGGIVVTALKSIPSPSMRSKFARWCISKGLSVSDSYYKPKETAFDTGDIERRAPHELSKIISNTRNEIRRLANDYTQEKDPKTKKDILKSIGKKKKEYSYYSTFSDGNEALSDTVGCYYLLRGLVNLIRKLIQNGKAVFADSDALSAKSYTEYIKDTVEETQKELETTDVKYGSNNGKYRTFYEEMKKSLTAIIDQANSLIEELKHSDVDKEYEVLKSTVDIMDNFRDKVKAINDMKKDVLKEDLEETSPYTNIKSNGIYSLNTGWVKHPVQQDIPDIDMEEFEKEFKIWEDKYFDLLDGLSNK